MEKKRNLNSIMIATMLLCVVAVSIFLFCGGARGKSAYQLALENGFVGTERQWLDSLKGTDGKDGNTIDYNALYTQAKSSGEISGDTTYLQFIQSYIAKTDSGPQAQLLYAIQNSIKSSVSIVVAHSEGTKIQTQSGAGSFYTLDEQGNAYIVTNYHVTYTGKENNTYYIFLYEDSYKLNEWKLLQSSSDDSSDFIDQLESDKASTIKASYIGGSKKHDLAILKVENNDRLKKCYQSGAITAVTLADETKDLVVGSQCYAVGNPFGEGTSATQGIISVAYENIALQDVENNASGFTMRAIRVSCAINGGNSGGGLYDANGKLIGVINSKRYYANSTGDIAEGSGFAIPLPVVKAVSEKIINECDGITKLTPQFYAIGITYNIDNCTAEYDQTDGCFKTKESISIADIAVNSYASKVNLAVGDNLKSAKITRKNGTTGEEVQLNHFYTLSDLLLTANQGDTLSLTVTRVIPYIGEKTLTVNIKFN